MEAAKLTRRVIQVLALSIFAYQMVEAVLKFIKFESVPSVGTMDIADAKLPDVFLCIPDSDQKDFKAHRANGYENFNAFNFGQVSNTSGFVSWEGNGTQTYEKVVEQLFYSMTSYDTWMVNGDLMNLTQHFTVFSGFCHKLEIQIPEAGAVTAFIGTFYGNPFQILLSDPEMQLYYAIYSGTLQGQHIETKGDKSLYYSLDLEEINWMDDMGECKSYGDGQTFQTYADCVASEQDKVFRPLLGCGIPWLTAPQDQGKNLKKLAYNKYLTIVFTKFSQ